MEDVMQLPAGHDRRLLTVGETAAYTGMSKSWLDKQRISGGFVPHVKIGRRVFYDRADVDAAVEQAKRLSTSDSTGKK
jgi:predicted DNA-binding transcriptional regulator AlpA